MSAIKDKSYIQQAMYYLVTKQPLLGNLLQELTIISSKKIPTAALEYDRKNNKFQVLICDEYFQKQSLDQRVAILIHELMHFTNGHVFRWDTLGTPKEQMLRNIAADMAINQFISDLPPNTIDVANYKMKDGTAFPKYRPMEEYFELLQQTTKQQPQSGKGEKKKGTGDGSDINSKQADGDEPLDEHEWEISDEERESMLQEAKELVKRSIDKTFKDYSLVPKGVKDLLEKIDTELRNMNYKGMLKWAIKKTMSAQDRVHTYYRPSKRFGNFAPGTTNEKMPYLNMYIDTSGSISITEMNQFLGVINGFLGAGKMKNCNVGFWHTDLYNFRKYKAKSELKEDDVESGGTDPGPVLKHIKKNNPNLSIILTDGCYSAENIKMDQQIIWIISENGDMNHPYKNIGMTISMKHLGEKK